MNTSEILAVLTEIRNELQTSSDARAYQAAEASIILLKLVEIQSATLQSQTNLNQ